MGLFIHVVQCNSSYYPQLISFISQRGLQNDSVHGFVKMTGNYIFKMGHVNPQTLLLRLKYVRHHYHLILSSYLAFLVKCKCTV